MADDSSEDVYIDSESDDDTQLSSSDGEASGDPAQSQNRKPRQARIRSGKLEPAKQRPSSQSREIIHEPDSLAQPGEEPSRRGQSRSRQPSKGQPTESRGNQSRSAGPRQRVNTRLPHYQDIVNSVLDKDDEEHVLSASQIGASFWTSREKTTFFRSLSLHGLGNLPSHVRAVGSKSEYEISVYLSLLQEGSASQQTAPIPKDGIPAAFQISEKCEAALEAEANAAAARELEDEIVAERAKYGDDFLVGEEAADRDELLYEQQEAELDDVEDHLSTSEDVKPVLRTSSPHEKAKSDQAFLLRLPEFLQLMKNIFMNNGEHEDLNWHHIEPVSKDSGDPAIHKSALDDLKNIVIQLTRRIVQAAIFQAMTRLRAGDSSRPDWTPLAAVREVDVHQAVTLLNMESKWRQYWASVAQRNRLAVYSDSKKYKDGRLGTKTGYRLSEEEIRRELGQEQESALVDGEELEIFEEDIENLVEGSDLFTDSEGASANELEANQGSSDERRPSRWESEKRKRALDPEAFARAEDTYLEALDRNRSAEEEIRLWTSLKIDPPQDLLHFETQKLKPLVSRTVSDRSRPWRSTLEYADDWELGISTPKAEDFLVMDLEGQRARKRRKAVEQMVRNQLSGSVAQHLNNDGELYGSMGNLHVNVDASNEDQVSKDGSSEDTVPSDEGGLETD